MIKKCEMTPITMTVGARTMVVEFFMPNIKLTLHSRMPLLDDFTNDVSPRLTCRSHSSRDTFDREPHEVLEFFDQRIV